MLLALAEFEPLRAARSPKRGEALGVRRIERRKRAQEDGRERIPDLGRRRGRLRLWGAGLSESGEVKGTAALPQASL